MSLGYIGFQSPKYEEWLSFGPDIFGFGLAPRGADGSVRLRMDDRHHRVSLHPGDIDELSYLGWEVAGRIEFEEGLRHLEKHGVAYTAASAEDLADRHVSAMVHFQDPAGFRHELYHSPEFSPCSFVPGRPIHGFVAENLGLGHAVLAVPEVNDELRAFATEVMGFKVFAGYRAEGPNGEILGLEFYRCNPRSHCMAYIPAKGMRGVTHMCVEVSSLDDVGRAWDMVQDRGIPIKYSLGRHQMDEMISFYVRTPTGFEFEYGWNGEMLDDSYIARKPSGVAAWGLRQMLDGWGSTVRPIDPS
nr:VOC family protein [Sphingobium sp. Sx8-8]